MRVRWRGPGAIESSRTARFQDSGDAPGELPAWTERACVGRVPWSAALQRPSKHNLVAPGSDCSFLLLHTPFSSADIPSNVECIKMALKCDANGPGAMETEPLGQGGLATRKKRSHQICTGAGVQRRAQGYPGCSWQGYAHLNQDTRRQRAGRQDGLHAAIESDKN